MRRERSPRIRATSAKEDQGCSGSKQLQSSTKVVPSFFRLSVVLSSRCCVLNVCQDCSAGSIFATFHARNFYADTWKTLVHAHDGASAARGKPRYQIMKMDCEGCEFSSLAPWVANTCTEQLLIEVHGCRNKAPNPSTWKGVLQGMHHLMTNLSLAGYTPFYLETNLYARHGTCFEMALRRSEHHESGCAEPRAGALEGAASMKRARDAASQSSHGQGAHRTAG